MIQRTLCLVGVGIALSIVGCGGRASTSVDPASAPASAEPGASVPDLCAGNPSDEELLLRVFVGLTPTPAADYLALRRLEVSLPRSANDDGRVVTLSERGTLCGSAADRASCVKTYGRIETLADPWWPQVFYTRADDVRVAKTTGQAMTLLGKVDSVEEAVFVGRQAGYRFTCDGPNPLAARAVGDAFELVAQAGGCGLPLERLVVRVGPDGTTEEISRTTTLEHTEECAQP